MARNQRDEGTGSSRRGFAAMGLEQRREIASKGGSASGGNFKNDPRRAAEAGREGGRASAESRNQSADSSV